MKTAAFKPLINILILLLAITFGCKKGDEEPPRSSENAIISFKFEANEHDNLGFNEDIVEDNITGTDIKLKVPFSTNLFLTPTIVVSDGATISPASGVGINFEETNPASYTVTAENGDEREYKVTVEVAQNTECKIKTFVFEQKYNTGVLTEDTELGEISEENNTIKLNVPYNTDVKNLVATFEVSEGATVKVGTDPQISGETGVDFSDVNGVKYTVTAQNGTSKQDYTVTVTEAPASSECEIKTFVFEEKNNKDNLYVDVDAGVITDTDILLTVPYNTDVKNLVATFEVSEGATVKVGTDPQISGETGVDFSDVNGVKYTVTAQNGTSKQDYTVTVTEAKNSASAITSFVFEQKYNTGVLTEDTELGEISEENNTIKLNVPYNTDVKNLVATFTVSEGATVKVGTDPQTSGETGVDFSDVNGVIYTVTAEDGNTSQDYTVTVKPQPSFATVSYYERENRVGAGDFEKPDLFEISDIAEGSYNYTLKIADKTANGTVEVKDGNGTIGGSTLSISDWNKIDDGNINVVLEIEEIEGIDFTYTVTKEQYKIRSWQDLQGMKYKSNGSYTLMNDIELPDPSITGGTFPAELPAEGFEPVGGKSNKFIGSFDGQNHVIRNFFIDRGISIHVGLFGYISGVTIEDVGIEISSGGVTGKDRVGGLVGTSNNHSTITNCYVIGGNVTGNDDYVGGLVGISYTGTITNSYAKVNVTGNNHVGGLVGNLAQNSTVNNCYTTGNVTGNNSVGGLVGLANSITQSSAYIKNSYATGDVTGSNYVGGLVGVVGQSSTGNHGTVYRSYATGNVRGTGNDGYAGGLVGRFFRGDIEDSYATGNVEGIQRVGGFFGRQHYSDALVKRCYATGKVTGEDDGSTGGFGGDQGNSSTTNSYWDMASAEQGERSSAGTGVSAASNLRKTEGKYYDTGQDPDAEVFVNWEFGTSDSEPWKWDDNGGKWPTLYWQ